MSFTEKITEYTRAIIARTHKNVEEKKMFGGLCFMVNTKMCVGVNMNKQRLLVRLDPSRQEEALKKPGCNPMEMKGKLLNGYVLIDLAAIDTDKKLEYWIKLALDFNSLAKSSKKKTTTKAAKA